MRILGTAGEIIGLNVKSILQNNVIIDNIQVTNYIVVVQ